ncbi:hypothetical protein TIFTF001_033510 [Ficus carica]|uniref:Uncharacterized protein n=1 Tax=Ficus carica TaxID=3494 RepID=A0AA88DYZ5_FICCA|nr:hypothetical protein TIFTF001_033510 [Ficus carica]
MILRLSTDSLHDVDDNAPPSPRAKSQPDLASEEDLACRYWKGGGGGWSTPGKGAHRRRRGEAGQIWLGRRESITDVGGEVVRERRIAIVSAVSNEGTRSPVVDSSGNERCFALSFLAAATVVLETFVGDGKSNP